VGNELLRLKRELQDCLRVDDLDRAIELRRVIKQHEMKRESFDALYETSRFEEMIVMGEPSQQYLEEADRLEREQKVRIDAIHFQRRKAIEEEARRAAEAEQRRQREQLEEEQRI